jgi:hypothetical protein
LEPSPQTGPMQILRQYVDIALLRVGPDVLPVSAQLLGFTVALYIAATSLLGLAMPGPRGMQAVVIIVDALVVGAWYWVVMRLAGKPERFLQTATAMFGVQFVLAPAVVVATWLFTRSRVEPTLEIPALFVLVVLGVWTLAVTGRILRAATDWPMISCIATVIAQSLVSQLVALSLLPPELTTAVPGVPA